MRQTARDDATCPFCGSSESAFAFEAVDRNRAISAERFAYRRCARCETLFLSDVPPDLARYYPADYYGALEGDRLDEIAEGERPKLDLIAPHAAPGGRLVEIGAGEGLFARLARRDGFDVTAIEMDGEACRRLRETIEVDVVESDRPEDVLEDLPPSRAIAMWHVLEHVPRPGRLVEAAAANLEPGGVLAIATPNPEAIGFKLLGARWAHVDAPRHLTLIPADALVARAAGFGLKLADLALDDPGGRHWNRFAWERALRRDPSRGPASRPLSLAAAVLTKAVMPVEGRGRRGAAYTALLVKGE